MKMIFKKKMKMIDRKDSVSKEIIRRNGTEVINKYTIK